MGTQKSHGDSNEETHLNVGDELSHGGLMAAAQKHKQIRPGYYRAEKRFVTFESVWCNLLSFTTYPFPGDGTIASLHQHLSLSEESTLTIFPSEAIDTAQQESDCSVRRDSAYLKDFPGMQGEKKIESNFRTD